MLEQTTQDAAGQRGEVRFNGRVAERTIQRRSGDVQVATAGPGPAGPPCPSAAFRSGSVSC